MIIENLSLVVITLNEQNNIERCLLSAPFVKDIVVLDSGSTDKTRELAQSLGARVFNEPWRGYSAQKTRAAELAQNDWVLSLDADEALSPEAVSSVIKLFKDSQGTPPYDGYEFNRLTYYLGRWMRHGGHYPDRQIRLFHRQKAFWTKTEVHERVTAQKVGFLKGDLLHWPFTTIDDQWATIQKYSTLRAKDFHKSGKKFSYFKMLTKPFFKFFQCYVLKRGFMDGRAGLTSAYMACSSTFLRWAKLLELQNKNCR